MTFELKPEHYVYASDVPSLMIIYPEDVPVSSCTVKSVEADPVPSNPSCSRNSQGQTVIVKDFITQDYVPGGDPIVLTLGEVINPKSTKPVDNLILILLANGRYEIDEYRGPTPWPLTTGSMSAVSVNPAGSYIAYDSNLKYEIMFSPKHDIPVDGYVEIWIPNEIIIPDTSFSTSSCSAP